MVNNINLQKAQVIPDFKWIKETYSHIVVSQVSAGLSIEKAYLVTCILAFCHPVWRVALCTHIQFSKSGKYLKTTENNPSNQFTWSNSRPKRLVEVLYIICLEMKPHTNLIIQCTGDILHSLVA